MQNLNSISGLYTKELYRNFKTIYTCFILKTSDEDIICKGKIQRLPFNTPVIVYGDYNYDNQNRKFFEIKKYEIKSNKEADTIKFLLGLKISGLNDKKIAEIIDYFNDSVIDVIKSCKTYKAFYDRIKPIISLNTAKELYNKIKRITKEYDLTIEVLNVGGDYHNISSLAHTYNKSALKVLKNNPYKIGFYADMSFYSCEQLALNNNIDGFSDKRAEGLLLFAIKSSMQQGNSYITIDELKKYVDNIQKNKDYYTPFEAVLSKAILKDDIVIEDNRIYMKYIYAMEENVARNIIKICKSANNIESIDYNVINEIERENNITLSNSQKKAFKLLESEGIKIITGGPGTGKTTLTNCLIKYIEKKHPNYQIRLCAPTGRAAQNLANKTGYFSETAHKMLGLRPYTNKNTKSNKMLATKKMEDYVYIIDESSMLDLELMDTLLQSLPTHAIIIFVGDKDQLPSVGLGNIFNDLMKSDLEKYVLTEVHRQNADSTIVTNAIKINNGDTNLICSNSDFDIVEVTDETTAMQFSLMYANEKNTQILTPLNKKIIGSYNLSKEIQSKQTFLCPGEKIYGDTTYHIGDKVILTHNNYDADYYNGDVGIISNIYDDGISIILDYSFDDKTGEKKEIDVLNENMQDVNLAYAITIHKSQGGEYPEVVIMLTKSTQNMLNRNLLYTAVTRAKQKVTIITQPDILQKTILTTIKERHSTLIGKINKLT